MVDPGFSRGGAQIQERVRQPIISQKFTKISRVPSTPMNPPMKGFTHHVPLSWTSVFVSCC